MRGALAFRAKLGLIALALGVLCQWWRRHGRYARFLSKLLLAYSPPKALYTTSHPFVIRHARYVHLPKRNKTLRVLYRPYSGVSKHKLPTLVFLHGLGGSMNQLGDLMQHFAGSAHILAIDNVGHGGSPDTQRPEDYHTLSIVADIAAVIEHFVSGERPLVLIAHSYGCCMATHLATRSEHAHLHQSIRAIVMQAPKALHSEKDKNVNQTMAKTPDPLLTLMRIADRWGGAHSNSVNRYLAPHAPESLRWKQLSWNSHLSNSQVKFLINGVQWVTPEQYRAIPTPVLLLGGEHDKVTPAQTNLTKIHELLNPELKSPDPTIFPRAAHQVMLEETEMVHAVASQFLVHTCGLTSLDPREHVVREPPAEKWSLKNLAKWKATPPVSALLVAQNLSLPLRAMKVLHGHDDVHSPKAFARAYPKVRLVIDFTAGPPPYDPRELMDAGVQYRKIATPSKVAPAQSYIDEFILTLRDFWGPGGAADNADREVVVHCHYGGNRSGFFLVAYLVAELKISVRDAIHAFEVARPPGIRHVHFKDELVIRYEPRKRVKSTTNSPTTPSSQASPTIITTEVGPKRGASPPRSV